jgi:D-glycero-D-manno-heptose 1,7-bisphosphate phosphatase
VNETVNKKIQTLDEITVISSNLRLEGKTIVTLNGSFDLFHPGHLFIISEARKQGDVLIIGVNSDASYKLYKDKSGPIINEKGRAEIIAALSIVDFVVLFDEPDPIAFLNAIKPHIHCNGVEYGNDCIETKTLESFGGKLHLIDAKQKGVYSTSVIVSAIASRYSAPKRKAIFLDRDGVINKDAGYTYKIEDFEFEHGIIDLLLYLKGLGYIFIIVTNQSGIGRGYYRQEDMERFHEHLVAESLKQAISFEGIYFCPHDPKKELCDCRKPGSVLHQKAIREHTINAQNSWSIGDKLSDCTPAKRVGARTILLSKEKVREKQGDVDFTVGKLSEVKLVILS